MQEDHQLTPAEQELEAALQQLHPTGHAIDRDRLMFTAGLRSARRAQRRWQGATGLVTMLLVASWMVRPPSPAMEQVAEAPVQAPPETVEIASRPLPPLPPMRPRREATDLAGLPPEIWPPVPQFVHLRNRVMEDGPDVLSEMGLVMASAGQQTGGNTRRQDDEPTRYRAFGPNRSIGG